MTLTEEFEKVPPTTGLILHDSRTNEDTIIDQLYSKETIINWLNSLAAAPPDAAASMQRVLEAADGIRYYIGMLLASSMSDHDKQKVMTVVAKYDAALSELRVREGK